MTDTHTHGQGPDEFDTDRDRYPGFDDVLRALLDDPDIPFGPVERVEVFCTPSGEASYRVWPPRSEEFIGGYYTNL